ncbi:hypothetical protein [Erwinia sp. Leaf53]|uniref:hypothetical protein n=1 Tax=Erwinia sp. Leaf53 TaxID=1736225 RepID=UPI0006F4AC56|nr:hypothetical protein [Erwinia sp. Leaf53]KQN57846.1 hypothetical protein ASF13_03355 [Erwinia sp. Leaf53]
MEFLQSLMEAFSLYRHIVVPVLSLLVLTVVVIRWWDQVSYFFLNLMCSLPVIGHIARLSRASEPRRTGTGQGLWYPSEEAICAKYWKYYRTSNHTADFYLHCVDYLSKVDERGRKPTSLLLWFCTAGLVALEAFIFALVLSPFIATNITANQAEASAIVVSVLIGVILVPATHRMGKELHRNTLLKKIRYWHTEARHSNTALALQNDKDISLETTYQDDNQPNYLQMLNRVPHNAQVTPQYWATGIAVALILFFAIGAYFVRAATIDNQDTQAVNGSPFSQQVSPAASPFDLPAEAVADNAAADNKAGAEIASNRVFASKLTFIILSVIFVGVQLIGILIGMYYSLVGIDSKAAAKYVGDFSSSQEFADFHAMRREQVARSAQDKLATLQNRLLMKRSLSQSEALTRLPTFQDYIEGKQQEADKREADQQARQLKKAAEAQAVSAAAAAVAASVVPAVASVTPAAPLAPAAAPVQNVAPAAPAAAPAENVAPTVTAAGYTPAAVTSAGYAPAPTAAPAGGSPANSAPVATVTAAAPAAPAPVPAEAPAATTLTAATAPANPAAEAELKQRISELGDLTVLNQEDLEVMAEGTDLPLAALVKHQKLQQVMNKARGATV